MLVARAAAPEDLSALLRLYAQLHPDDTPLAPEIAEAVFDRIRRTPETTIFVFELNHRVAATSYLNVVPNLTRSAAPYAVIENVVVDEALRNRGLGKHLMASTLAAAWRAGCYKAMLLTGSRRPATHAFYRSCGFEQGSKTAYLARPHPPAEAGTSQ